MASYVKITSTKLWRNTGRPTCPPMNGPPWSSLVYLQPVIYIGLRVRTRVESNLSDVPPPDKDVNILGDAGSRVTVRDFPTWLQCYSGSKESVVSPVVPDLFCPFPISVVRCLWCVQERRSVEQTTQSDVIQNWSVTTTRGRRGTLTFFMWEIGHGDSSRRSWNRWR